MAGQSLDDLHSALQANLKDITKVSDLLPYIEKCILLESLKIQISHALENALKKEKKMMAENTETANGHDSGIKIIRSLYNTILSPTKQDEDDLIDDKARNMMQPRQIDDDSKSDHHHHQSPMKTKADLINESEGNLESQDHRNKSNNIMNSMNSINSMDSNGSSNNYPRRNFGAYPNRPPRQQQQFGGGPPAWSTSICYNCKGTGHFARECPLKSIQASVGGDNISGNRYRSNLKCYHCGQDGHFARECPQEGNDELNEKCFRCGQKGHWARDCQLKPSPNRFANDKCNRCGKIGHWARDCELPYNRPSSNFKINDKCNRCGKLGHWARDCDLPRNDGGYDIDDDY